jgi:hypothetical protein
MIREENDLCGKPLLLGLSLFSIPQIVEIWQKFCFRKVDFTEVS